MKLRPFFILLLFVVSAGILVWVYHTTAHTQAEPSKSQWAETISDLSACCRRKHVKSAQYDHFSGIANEERYREATLLFRAMAQSERLQEHNCANAIVRLGGIYLPPSKVVVFRGTTDDNLKRSISYERQSNTDQNGDEIDRAMARNNRYAARVMIWAAAGDLRHLELMEDFHKRLAQKSKETHTYLVCPACGYLFDDAYLNPYCPLCLVASREFIHFK